MKGLYLYGICSMRIAQPSPPTGGSGYAKGPMRIKNKNIKGIDDSGKVGFLRHKDIGAVVSKVDLEEFDSEEIQRKAAEDLEWIKSKAIAHERVIEAVMKELDAAIIPMKFGTIFKTRENLLDSLKENYAEFKELLEKLKEKEEWALKAYADTAILANAIKNNSSLFQEKLKEASSLPAGKDYFLEKEIEEAAAAEAQKTLDDYRPLFLKAFQPIAEETKENKILDKALTQKNEPMVFNGAFLIKKGRSKDFLEQVQKLETEFKDRGLVFESSGPWPPYNFVE